MDSSFNLRFTRFFSKQWKKYGLKEKEFIKEKLVLIRKKPFRFEKLSGYKFVFKVKLSIEKEYSRLIYAVFMPDSKHITILGVFDRKANYKDF